MVGCSLCGDWCAGALLAYQRAYYALFTPILSRYGGCARGVRRRQNSCRGPVTGAVAEPSPNTFIKSYGENIQKYEG